MEILNIEYNVGRLVLIALNKFKTKVDAAKELGVSDRQMYTYINHYCIYMNVVTGNYFFGEKSVMQKFIKQNPNPKSAKN